MPEQHFEKQARDMANGFEIKPRAEVWQNVRNAIQQPKRKRKITLWWWLLPLSLVAVIALYSIHTSNTNPETKVAGTQTINDSQHNFPAQAHTKSAKILSKKDTLVITPFVEKTAANKLQSKTTVNDTNIAKQNVETTPDNVAITHDTLTTIPNVNIGNIYTNDIGFAVEWKNKHRHATDSLVTLQNGLPLQLTDSVHAMPLLSDTLLLANAVPATLPMFSRADSIVAGTSMAGNKTDSFNVVKSPAIIQKDSVGTSKATSSINKKIKTKIQWGLLAEAGIAERRSPVFSFAGTDKSNNVPVSSPNTNGSGSVGGVTGRGGFYFNNNIEQGAAFGAGVAVQKTLSRSIDVFADVAYHYQTFHVAITAYKDSLVLNNYLTSLAGSYKATQRFHFTSLFAGINWHFVNAKHIRLGIGAGIDNLFLLAANQQISSLNGTNFSLADAVETSDSAFTKNSFYTYQPGLFVGLPVTLQMGKQQLQLVPFARSSFRPFEQHVTSNNNHLFTAGLRAVYFFK